MTVAPARDNSTSEHLTSELCFRQAHPSNHCTEYNTVAAMPNYRSVTLSIMSQWEMKQFPEFPHPDSVHNTYRGPGLVADGSTRRQSTEPTSTAEPVCKAERNPGKVPLV